jgi:hypothetical protein
VLGGQLASGLHVHRLHYAASLLQFDILYLELLLIESLGED